MPTLHWSKEEDCKLRELVDRHGPNKWAAIAKDLGSKTSKQCRRRWKNVLDMDAKTSTWTTEEDRRLIMYHKELGNKWTEIANDLVIGQITLRKIDGTRYVGRIQN